MRRLAPLLFVALPLAARAEPEAEGPHETGVESAVCTASANDEECREYWEHTINWWSWDYKVSPAQDREHRHMPPPFGFALINFAVFAMIMYRLAAQPLITYVRTRHITIKGDLEEAAELKAEAQARLTEYEQRIAGLDQEVAELIAQVRAEAEAEKARLIEQAAEQAKRLAADAKAQIASELERTRAALRREAVEAALATAESVLREKLSTDDQKRLAERFVVEMEGSKAAGARS